MVRVGVYTAEWPVTDVMDVDVGVAVKRRTSVHHQRDN